METVPLRILFSLGVVVVYRARAAVVLPAAFLHQGLGRPGTVPDGKDKFPLLLCMLTFFIKGWADLEQFQTVRSYSPVLCMLLFFING